MEKKKVKNIAMIGLTFPFRGGISHYSTVLVRHLREKYRVEFYTLNRQYPKLLFPGKTQLDISVQKIAEQNKPIIDSINPLSWIRGAIAIIRGNFDLVVIQWWNPFFGFSFGTIANLVSFISSTPICFICHNVLPHESTIFDRILLKYAFWRTSNYIVHSEKDLWNLKKIKPDAEIRKNVHPTYSLFSDYGILDKEAACTKLGLQADDNILLYFGMVRPYKGVQYLIEAMAEVVKEIDCTLMIVGEFYEDKSKYLALIDDLQLGMHIRVVDDYIKNEDVPLYFCSCDIVVLPYISATQSGIIQIAFGFNKPVITTDVGGLAEVVVEGKTGLVVKSRSGNSVAEAILKFYKEIDKDKMQEEVQNRSTDFGWDLAIDSVEYFFDIK